MDGTRQSDIKKLRTTFQLKLSQVNGTFQKYARGCPATHIGILRIIAYPIQQKQRNSQIDCQLDEAKYWAHSIPTMQKSLDESREFCEPRCIAFVSPSNPTGKHFTRHVE